MCTREVPDISDRAVLQYVFKLRLPLKNSLDPLLHSLPPDNETEETNERFGTVSTIGDNTYFPLDRQIS